MAMVMDMLVNGLRLHQVFSEIEGYLPKGEKRGRVVYKIDNRLSEVSGVSFTFLIRVESPMAPPTLAICLSELGTGAMPISEFHDLICRMGESNARLLDCPVVVADSDLDTNNHTAYRSVKSIEVIREAIYPEIFDMGPDLSDLFMETHYEEVQSVRLIAANELFMVHRESNEALERKLLGQNPTLTTSGSYTLRNRGSR